MPQYFILDKNNPFKSQGVVVPLLKSLSFFLLIFLLYSCSKEEENIEKTVIPKKVILLFVTQPSCPSCEKLEATMNLKKPKKLIENYFKVKKIYLGEPLPSGLIEPNGTPTVYFLGAKNEILIEPLIGEKSEASLLPYLEDALYEFKHIYGVDLTLEHKKTKNRENNETNTTL